MNQQIGSLLHLGFGLVLLWMSWYVGWRQYRIDHLRKELFALRNELFVFAANGGIGFDNPAYVLLTSRINAVIRFAHTATFTRLVLYAASEHHIPTPGAAELETSLKEAIARLPESAKTKLSNLYERKAQKVAMHVVIGSLPLLFLVALAAPMYALKAWLQRQKDSPARVVSRGIPIVLIEEQAQLAQERESQGDMCELLQHA
jgi:hypothetical protein